MSRNKRGANKGGISACDYSPPISHQMRDENDLVRHIDYIHYNPVKHGLVNSPSAWPYSSFHRYVKQGDYDADWGAGRKIEFDAKVGYE